MDLLHDIGKSITGNIDKATLYVKKDISTNKSNMDLRDELLKNVEMESNLGSAFKKAFPSANKVATKGYYAMKVKYNPSSIKFSTRAGNSLHCGVGGAGMNQITQISTSSQTMMSVSLVFDDVNIADAFYNEKVALSVDNAASIYKKLKGEEYSVQAQVDGLISLITQSEHRSVVFYWSEMAFAGDVTAVKANYTMFNTAGNPIRGEVNLEIFQKDSHEEGGVADTKYWDRAFDNLFKHKFKATGTHFDASEIKDQLGGIINL